jgi:hypothetical protein
VRGNDFRLQEDPMEMMPPYNLKVKYLNAGEMVRVDWILHSQGPSPAGNAPLNNSTSL